MSVSSLILWSGVIMAERNLIGCNITGVIFCVVSQGQRLRSLHPCYVGPFVTL